MQQCLLQLEVEIVKIIIVAEDIPRVQSITINGTMNVQAVNEMGNKSTVGYQKQVPDVE